MIPHTEPQWQALSWQQELRDAIRCPTELLEFLGLEAESIKAREQASEQFPILVPRPFARRMQRGNPQDPLLLQVLPGAEELASPGSYTLDPLQEANQNPVPGLIHKYHGRVLLIAAPGCAVNCRYCFRRHFDYNANNPSRDHWPETLDYIEADPSITEVILSGGDPLLLADRALAELVERLANIDHLRTLRIHSRIPVVLPARITSALCEILDHPRLRTMMVIHCNHANEIDSEVIKAMGKLARAGVRLLNQSVLLAGVNDCPKLLAELSEALFDSGITPYYLHTLDRVKGAAHFEIPETRALDIYRDLLGRCPGYLVPRLVSEKPGQKSKTPLVPLHDDIA